MAFRTRAGPTLETELGNSWPIVEIFRDGHYDVPISWSDLERVLDVGGHVGAFTTWVAARAPNARIDVFEPEPRNFADLVANLERNRLRDRVIAINAAVGSRDERCLLSVPRQRDMSSRVPRLGTIEVDCVSLDGYVREHIDGPIDIMKLDCEGAEWEILPSLGGATFERVRHCLVEFHARRPSEIDTAVRDFVARGFEVWTLATSRVPGEASFVSTVWATRV